MDGAQKSGKGGSALKRLKSTLNIAGVLTSNPRKRANTTDAKERTTRKKQKLAELRGENPFELKFAKRKHEVLGKKVDMAGRPGATKKRAEEKRIQTILPELKRGKKESTFHDKRFGENNPNLSLEDKMMERFVREKQKSTRRGDFNIDDVEEDDEFGGLTHLGRSLDFDGMKDFRPDDSDEEEEDTEVSNFGGFDPEAEESREGKSRNEIMKEVIAKSKYYKMERQKAKDENDDLRRELDNEVDDVRALLLAMEESAVPVPKPGPKPPTKTPEYDVLIHQLASEKRSKPTDRLKSEEELAMELKEKLERLESDRQRRLLGVLPEEEAMRGRKRESGDYLEENVRFAMPVGAEEIEVPKALQYKDGKLVKGDVFVKKAKVGKEIAAMRDEEDEEEGSDDEDDGEGESGSGEEEGSKEGSEGSEEGSDDDEDAKESEEGSDADLEENIQANGAEHDGEPSDEETPSERDRKEHLREERRQAALKQLPYVFPAPTSYTDFEAIVSGRPAADLDTVINRLRSLYSLKLHADNRAKLTTLYGILMDHLGVCYASSPPDSESADVLVKHIRQFSQELSESAFTHAHDYLTTLNERLEKALLKASSRPILDTAELAKLQMIAQVFPTSDFRHPVTTPLQMIVCRYLDLKLLRNARDMGVGLALCNMVVQFQKLSKRFMPEVTSYLQHLLATLCVRREADKEKFKVVAKVKLGTGTKASPLLLVVPAAAVVQRLAQLYSDLPSLPEVFEPHVAALGDLAKHASGAAKEKLQSALSTIRETIDANLKDRESLQLQQHKPVPIASFLPKFEESFNANKRYDPNRERQQLKKLQVQHKKEFKGAMREVRKDTQFVHRQRLQDIKSKDAAYKKKMDRIEGLIGREAGELKQAERKAARGK